MNNDSNKLIRGIIMAFVVIVAIAIPLITLIQGGIYETVLIPWTIIE